MPTAVGNSLELSAVLNAQLVGHFITSPAALHGIKWPLDIKIQRRKPFVGENGPGDNR